MATTCSTARKSMKPILAILTSASIVLAGCDNQTKKSAALMTGGNPDIGKTTMADVGCASCHTIPGVSGADGMIGPSLEKMAGRAYIGGVLKNTPTNMLRWLHDPPGVDPMTAMPNLHLTDQQERDL